MAGSSVAITPAQNNTLDAYRRLGLQPFVEGRVELECLVIPSGALAECRIVTERPANYGLGELAIALSPGVLYTPARLAGAPVDEFPARVPFTFEAANAREPVPPSLPPASPAQSAPTLSPKYEGDLPLADPAALDCHFSTGAPC
jgi:hypothetical protein